MRSFRCNLHSIAEICPSKSQKFNQIYHVDRLEKYFGNNFSTSDPISFVFSSMFIPGHWAFIALSHGYDGRSAKNSDFVLAWPDCAAVRTRSQAIMETWGVAATP